MNAQAEEVLRHIRARCNAQHALENPGVGNYSRLVLFADSCESGGSLVGEINRDVVLHKFKARVVLEELKQRLLLGLWDQVADSDPAGERNSGIGSRYPCVDLLREHLRRAGRASGVDVVRYPDLIDELHPVLY